MAESEELETLVYCLGQVGGEHNYVITEGSGFYSKYDYTRDGYARYILEARKVVKFQHRLINYFMDSVKSELQEDPLAFIDAESEEDLLFSIQKMKKQWKEMFKEHQRELREVLKNPKKAQSSQECSEESNASSSAKIPRLDPDPSSETSTKSSKSDPEESEKTLESDKQSTPDSSTVGVPVDQVEFPKSIFQRKLKEFNAALKAAYHDLVSRIGKTLERLSSDVDKIQDLKGFTLKKMATFAKWKFALKTLDHLIPELEKKFKELDLDFYAKKENEKRLTDWLFFDDGKRDRKYHHRLLITMELTGPIEEVSAVVCKQLRRWGAITQSLADKLPEESEAFEEKVKALKYEVLYGRPMKKPMKTQKSSDSGDTLFNVDDMPEET